MNQTAQIEIPEVSDLDVAFSCAKHLPSREESLERYRQESRDPYAAVMRKWFYEGLPNGLEGEGLHPRPGVDKKKALRVIKACMGSWEPSHEHKTGGVAILLDRWFEFKGKKAA